MSSSLIQEVAYARLSVEGPGKEVTRLLIMDATEGPLQTRIRCSRKYDDC